MGRFLIFAGVGAADVFGRQVLGVCVAKWFCAGSGLLHTAGGQVLGFQGQGRKPETALGDVQGLKRRVGPFPGT